jgi:hypothetical protein
MPNQPINCDTLGDLDGGAARAIVNAALRDAVNDLEDRAHQDKKPRKVVITLTFSHLENGLVDTRVEASVKAPARRTAPTIGEYKRDGSNMRVQFHPLNTDDPRQKAIEDLAD